MNNTDRKSESLFSDALAADRRLKRERIEYYRSDPKAFRDTLRRARARVFRMKPGPKPQQNPAIARAARERGQGAPWQSLWPKYIEHYAELSEHTRALAEDGFRRRVNDYLRNHPRLRMPKQTPARNAAV
jgi:hypothetical protein